MTTGGDASLKLRIQGTVLIIVIFVVGVLAGSAAERVRASREKPMRPFRQPGELPRPFARLDLTEEQRTQISDIFESSRPRADSVLQELMPHLRAINDSIQAEIREVLTPEQVEVLETEFERGMPPGGMDRRWMRPFLPDSPPGGRMRPRRPGG